MRKETARLRPLDRACPGRRHCRAGAHDRRAREIHLLSV